MTKGALRFRGTDPFTEQSLELWVVDGRITYEPVASAETAIDGGWIIPGLVDAHNHVGIAPGLGVTIEQARQAAYADARAGALLIREVGSPLDTHPLDDDPLCPRFIRSGRHIARPKRYLRGYGVDLVAPDELPAEVARQAAAGDGWVKIVGDWIDRETGDLAPLWDRSTLEAAVTAGHEAGARITAHVFGTDALGDIIGAGFDCIEHGTGLTGDLIDQLVERSIALVPTVIQVENFPGIADGADRYPVYQANMRALHAGAGDVFAAAREAGVRMFTGTDAGGFITHGRIVDEIEALAALGWRPMEALAAASTDARAWLGADALGEGERADFLVVADDPREHVAAVRAPAAIMCSGVRIR
ncbi:amidohydrolase family protein [Gordonia pseudamarae]|uniref:Amidohydrolase family protein n=1 Tax=Gordonia pseudamarae TaxID=2831662 RepID=A0ABX6II21_9ACTN|nr:MULTISPECIES: amidohydrolase family protein [Gordonia]MBD0021041.1 amidohydrolase family protein [Gordonia sp. (in: high G+C Gram-positive bacteria)]QHN26121.1 amidohydrolase family protein [Gordonia pseudamarae]QHN35016.1 amidohydrolase family protein [Gordonia pseudamarae]